MNTKQPDPAEYPFGRKEVVDLEFKEAANALPKNLFETICAFLNMDGGLVVLA
ncbi:MAG: RNA-binding domain-containing protein [bacterium]